METGLKMVAYNTTAACGNIATVRYYYVHATSDCLHVRGELFGQIDAHHH